jgi:hypothetical protein
MWGNTKTTAEMKYCAPQLTVYGAMAELTASGSGPADEPAKGVGSDMQNERA